MPGYSQQQRTPKAQEVHAAAVAALDAAAHDCLSEGWPTIPAAVERWTAQPASSPTAADPVSAPSANVAEPTTAVLSSPAARSATVLAGVPLRRVVELAVRGLLLIDAFYFAVYQPSGRWGRPEDLFLSLAGALVADVGLLGPWPGFIALLKAYVFR